MSLLILGSLVKTPFESFGSVSVSSGGQAPDCRNGQLTIWGCWRKLSPTMSWWPAWGQRLDQIHKSCFRGCRCKWCAGGERSTAHRGQTRSSRAGSPSGWFPSRLLQLGAVAPGKPLHLFAFQFLCCKRRSLY